MADAVVETMNKIQKATADDKMAEVISEEIISNRKRKKSKEPKEGNAVKPEEAEGDDEEEGATRSRKGVKKS